MHLEPYPLITQALELLLLDNIGDAPEADAIRAQLFDHELPEGIVLDAVEGELATLSADEFLELCIGDEARKPLVSSETEYLLDLFFNWL